MDAGRESLSFPPASPKDFQGSRTAMDIVLEPLIQVILIAVDIYIWMIIAMAILSWLVTFNVVNTRNDIVRTIGNFLYRITEPALAPIRRFLPNLGGIDISPIILILVLIFLQRMLINLLLRI